MEKEGLVRAVKFLKKKKFKVDTLVTDRHKQIAKWLRENQKSIDHRYDIWHLAKCMLALLSEIYTLLAIIDHYCIAALQKKLEKTSKLKDCDLIGEWNKSVINHLYWSAVSTPDGNGDLIKAKWMSVVNHVHNKHKGHGKNFPVCKHKKLGRRARKIKWFKPRKLLVI